MSPKEKYAEELEAKGNLLLQGYADFLTIYLKNISDLKTVPPFEKYNKIDANWQKKINNHRKVFFKFNNNNQYQYNKNLLSICQVKINNITISLDRIKCELHDELCSLNKNNDLFGLKYNRYQTNGLNPVYIDIKT